MTVVEGPWRPAPKQELWLLYSLDLNGAGTQPIPNMINGVKILQGHPEWANFIWYDDFPNKTMRGGRLARNGEVYAAEWNDDDDVDFVAFMQGVLGIQKFSIADARAAVRHVAALNRIHSAQEWLWGLEWDGQPRLEQFLTSGLGCDDTAYNRAVSFNFWVGLAKRIVEPGCKLDTMMVLEGQQGQLKSSALAAIGGEWYLDCNQKIGTPDFTRSIQGKLVVEFGELASFRGAGMERIKQALSCQADRMVQKYEKHARDYHRHCVFVGTTNHTDWNSDETGARRFWPVKVGKVSLSYIHDQRDQLFAEAAFQAKSGALWWLMPDAQTLAEQEARYDVDVWEPIIESWLEGRSFTTMAELLLGALFITTDRMDRVTQLRAAKVIRRLKWDRKLYRIGDKVIRGWAREDAVTKK